MRSSSLRTSRIQCEVHADFASEELFLRKQKDEFGLLAVCAVEGVVS